MAKLEPTFTLEEMEENLGYKVGASNRPGDTENRFYSNLRPVPGDAYELIKKDHREFITRKLNESSDRIPDGVLPKPGQSEASMSARQ